MTEDTNFLDTQQAARFLGLSAKTLARYRVADIEQRILEALRSSGRVGAVDRLQTLRGEIDVLLALLARDLRLTEVEDSFGRIFLAVGADILPVAQAQPALADVAASIAATEEAWGRGEVVMQTWHGAKARAGD